MTTNSPNMNLPLSTIGVDSGLLWEQNLNSSLILIDLHDHSPGNGVQITPTGLNINATLPFNNFSASALSACSFTAQISLATLRSIYVIGADLYYNDGNSNVVQLTSGGVVNATSSGISSGSATASFVSSVLVVNAAANTPANIQGGSLLLGNNVAASKFLTLSPPAAMAANFSLILPSLPAVTNLMTLDSSGNIAAVTNVDNSTIEISANNLRVKDGGITRPKLAALGQQLSSSSGSFSTASASYVDITNLTVTITTSGRPVQLALISDGSDGTIKVAGNSAVLSSSSKLLRASSDIAFFPVSVTFPSASISNLFIVPVSSFSFTDVIGAGTYTYKMQVSVLGGTFICGGAKLIAYEIG